MLSFVAKLNKEQVMSLIREEQISGIVILPMKDHFKDLISEFLEDNTGFSTNPVVGISRVLGETGLKNIWDDLSNFIPIKSGDVIIEFALPEDLVAQTSYADFLALNKKDDLFCAELYNYLKIDYELGDDTIVSVCPILRKEYAKYFTIVGDNWQQDTMEPIDSSKLSSSSFFI